jgi:hypothetical protein
MKIRGLITAAVVAMCCANTASADSHYNKTISLLEVPAGGDCYFFQLAGVSQADPVVPNSPWFAISKTSPSSSSSKELYAILLAARLQGTTLNRVLTSGNIVCGHAQVWTIDL